MRRSLEAPDESCRAGPWCSWRPEPRSPRRPRARSGARLKENVTAGNWPWCATASGVVEGCVVRERAERHLLAGARTHVDIRQRIGGLLEFGSHFHHHMVLVERLVHDRDLRLAESVVQGVIDRSTAKCPGARRYRGRSPGRPASPRFCKSLFTSRSCGSCAQLLLHDRRPVQQIGQVVALQRVLELRVAGAPADLDLLHRLQKERRAGNASQLGPQPVGDLERARLCAR